MPPNLRYLLGNQASRALNTLLSSKAFPLMRGIPYGVSVWYDAQRIAGGSHLKTIFDVGANVGQTASRLVQYFPGSEINCFEPASEPFEALERRAKQWGKVRVHKLALGECKGSLNMMVGSGADSELNTFVSDFARSDATRKCEIVPVDTVDDFCNERNIPKIDIFKMDVQGWELKVLAGAKKMLSDGAISFVFTEVGFLASTKDMVLFSDMHDAMQKNNFVLSGFYDCFRWGNKAQIYFCNCLYSHSRLAT